MPLFMLDTDTVSFALRGEVQHARAVGGLLHVAEAVHLHDVAQLAVDDEPADDGLRVEGHLGDGQPWSTNFCRRWRKAVSSQVRGS
jgi:hypothetical protein